MPLVLFPHVDSIYFDKFITSLLHSFITTIIILCTLRRKKGDCLQKEIIQGTVPGGRARGRPSIVWTENIRTWMEMPIQRIMVMAVDREGWRRLVHKVTNPRIKDG